MYIDLFYEYSLYAYFFFSTKNIKSPEQLCSGLWFYQLDTADNSP